MISISLFYCCKKMFTHMNMGDWEKSNETLLPKKEAL